MENTRPILYGVAGYAEIRQVNAWFIDRILISTSSRRGGGATSTTTTISNGTLKVEVASTARNSSNQGLMDGSTVDLSGRTGSWNSRFSNTQNHLDTNTKVSFAANATITRSG